jgi:hypothetical protein
VGWWQRFVFRTLQQVVDIRIKMSQELASIFIQVASVFNFSMKLVKQIAKLLIFHDESPLFPGFDSSISHSLAEKQPFRIEKEQKS